MKAYPGAPNQTQTKYTGQIGKHDTGSQHSDPKVWNGENYTGGHGPQLDSIRIYNYVRLVRDAF